VCSKKYRTGRQRIYLPSAGDIEKACDQIQESWTAWEHRKRSGYLDAAPGDVLPWTPPVVPAMFSGLYLLEDE